MWGDSIETFKIIKGISNYASYFFNISSRTGNFTVKAAFKNLVY